MCKQMLKSKKRLLIALAITAVVFAAVIIIVKCFSTLEYYQYGFKKHAMSGSVDRKEPYGAGGRYMLGPEYTFLTLPADARFINFDNVHVFAKDKLEVTINAHMQYFLRKDQINLLHKKYDIDFEPIIKSNALSSLKNKAPSFHAREFFRNRTLVEEEMFLAIREHISGACCESECVKYDSCIPGCINQTLCSDTDHGFYVDARYFQLGAIDMPSGLKSKFLRTQILYEEANTEDYLQSAQLERKNIDSEVKEIENEAKEIREQARAEAALLVSQATANGTLELEAARSEGLHHLYTKMEFTDPTHKASFDYLRTLRKQKGVDLAVNFQQLIAGNLQ